MSERLGYAFRVDSWAYLLSRYRRSAVSCSQLAAVSPSGHLRRAGVRSIDRRFGLDAVGLVADPDPHASVKERLHASVDLAVVKFLQNVF
jgi:hypothetical protein